MRSMVEGHAEGREPPCVPLHHPAGGPPPRSGEDQLANGFFALRRVNRTGTASNPSSRRMPFIR